MNLNKFLFLCFIFLTISFPPLVVAGEEADDCMQCHEFYSQICGSRSLKETKNGCAGFKREQCAPRCYKLAEVSYTLQQNCGIKGQVKNALSKIKLPRSSKAKPSSNFQDCKACNWLYDQIKNRAKDLSNYCRLFKTKGDCVPRCYQASEACPILQNCGLRGKVKCLLTKKPRGKAEG